MEKLYKEIIFITDDWNKETTFSLKRIDIEGNTKKTVDEILIELERLSNCVVMYKNPQDFLNNIHKHSDAIVLSTYYGTASQNSKALIPSICEANNIPFVGAGSYTQMLCNDKHLSKKYISDFGLQTPKGFLIRNSGKSELEMIRTLNTPLVVKPNYGGGSNGISSKNLVSSYNDAEKLVCKLLNYQNLPILVEEYIPGYEVEIIIFGNNSEILLKCEVGLEVDGIDYFKDQIWGYESKKEGLSKNNLKYTNYVSSNDWEKIYTLFYSFKKAEIMRIDCRIFEGKLYVLELSPDCYLGSTGGVAKAFYYNKITYSEMFNTLIKNTLATHC